MRADNLIDGKFISGSRQISESGSDESPFDGWGPKENGFRTGRVVPSGLGERRKDRIDELVSGFTEGLVEKTVRTHDCETGTC